MTGDADERGSDVGEQEIVENLKRSAANALQALDHFKASLEAAGFVRSAEAYVKMADTLAGQRLWSAAKAPPDLDARFAQLAERAGEIDRILAPYVEAMRKIAALQALAATGTEAGAAAPAEPSGEPVLAALRDAPRGLSVTALRAQLGLSTRELRQRLASLEGAGRVRAIRRGGRVRWMAAGGDRDGTASTTG